MSSSRSQLTFLINRAARWAARFIIVGAAQSGGADILSSFISVRLSARLAAVCCGWLCRAAPVGGLRFDLFSQIYIMKETSCCAFNLSRRQNILDSQETGARARLESANRPRAEMII